MEKLKRNNSAQEKTITSAINIINFFGWSLAFNTITCSAILSYFDEEKSQTLLAISLFILKFIQTFQISEIFLGLVNTRKIPVLSLLQISGRLFTTWGFMSSDNPFVINFLIIFCWSLADAVRTAYYMFKDRHIIGVLRYNLFILNYPVGFFSELLLMETYVRKSHSKEFLYFIRFIQISFFIGFCLLYAHLLKNRKKYYRESKSKNE